MRSKPTDISIDLLCAHPYRRATAHPGDQGRAFAGADADESCTRVVELNIHLAAWSDAQPLANLLGDVTWPLLVTRTTAG
ncbi:MAG: hypothetical protein QOK16_1474 [Solirubrobacteraceae bacterium]|jgi:hypothetical protein|nr:hypothetical protein [Solirubrobacteraceae bacterium]